jgi:S-(hydroxymethyl)glutathione dehydrogenase/alcohol dehydrogenase
VTSVKPGDHVCSSYIPSCGKCGYCISGQPTLCALRDKPRWFMLDGTARVPEERRRPASLPAGGGLRHARRAARAERHSHPQGRAAGRRLPGELRRAGRRRPVFNRAKVPVGASVAVWGCGGVGLNTIQMARLVGAARSSRSTSMQKKLDWATEFGATHVVDASREDPSRA